MYHERSLKEKARDRTTLQLKYTFVYLWGLVGGFFLFCRGEREIISDVCAVHIHVILDASLDLCHML